LKIKNGGLKEKIVEGHQFAKTEENILTSTNAKEDISTLEVVWYETFNDEGYSNIRRRTGFTKLLG
jgi:hypothetical protein